VILLAPLGNFSRKLFLRFLNRYQCSFPWAIRK
jgi:hypothetical protein